MTFTTSWGRPACFHSSAIAFTAFHYLLTIGLGREVAAEGVRVNAIRPGIIDTEIHDSSGIKGRVKLMRDAIPMKREGTAEEVADAILWLCSDQSSYVTGSIIPVAGGRC